MQGRALSLVMVALQASVWALAVFGAETSACPVSMVVNRGMFTKGVPAQDIALPRPEQYGRLAGNKCNVGQSSGWAARAHGGKDMQTVRLCNKPLKFVSKEAIGSTDGVHK